jgi:hypothetical protein
MRKTKNELKKSSSLLKGKDNTINHYVSMLENAEEIKKCKLERSVANGMKIKYEEVLKQLLEHKQIREFIQLHYFNIDQNSHISS